MKNATIAILGLLMIGGTAMAQLSRQAGWADGPARHLMTKDEVARWQTLKSDEEAEAFIALFWARRDPTPETARNEFREEFEARVAAADEHFGTRTTRGALTDRGRTLILLGAPFQMAKTEGSAATQRRDGDPEEPELTPLSDSAKSHDAKMVWTYSNDRKPQFIKRKDFEVQFVDRGGRGEWEFARTGRSGPDALFQEAITHYIVSPAMTTVPAHADAIPAAPARATAFRNAELKAAYEQFRAEKKTSAGSGYLTWGEFVTTEGVGFVPVQLYIPSSAGMAAGKQVVFFGAVENAAGEVVEVFEEPMTLQASGGDVYVDRSILLEPGQYVTTVGLVADGKPLTINSTAMKIEGLDPKAPGTSQLILSNNAFALPQAQDDTDPFAFGGLKIVPKGDGTFTTQDELWYFVEMRNPGVGDAGAPKVQIKIEVQGDVGADRPVKFELPLQEAQVLELKGVENHYGLGMSFPLSDFKPGDYKMKIRVLDTVLKKSYELEREFKIRG